MRILACYTEGEKLLFVAARAFLKAISHARLLIEISLICHPKPALIHVNRRLGGEFLVNADFGFAMQYLRWCAIAIRVGSAR